jgi:hypothetical protein
MSTTTSQAEGQAAPAGSRRTRPIVPVTLGADVVAALESESALTDVPKSRIVDRLLAARYGLPRPGGDR